MTCKYCGAQIAPGETTCGNLVCMRLKALELMTELTPGELWAVFALTFSARPKKNLRKIDRETGLAAISVLRERFLTEPNTRDEGEQAIALLTECIEHTIS